MPPRWCFRRSSPSAAAARPRRPTRPSASARRRSGRRRVPRRGGPDRAGRRHRRLGRRAARGPRRRADHRHRRHGRRRHHSPRRGRREPLTPRVTGPSSIPAPHSQQGFSIHSPLIRGPRLGDGSSVGEEVSMRTRTGFLLAVCLLLATEAHAQRQMERLGPGRGRDPTGRRLGPRRLAAAGDRPGRHRLPPRPVDRRRRRVRISEAPITATTDSRRSTRPRPSAARSPTASGP